VLKISILHLNLLKMGSFQPIFSFFFHENFRQEQKFSDNFSTAQNLGGKGQLLHLLPQLAL